MKRKRRKVFKKVIKGINQYNKGNPPKGFKLYQFDKYGTRLIKVSQ